MSRDPDWSRRRLMLAGAAAPLVAACTLPRFDRVTHSATTEFEQQEFIWLSWNEHGFLDGPPMTDTLVPLIAAIAPEVRVRILYNAGSVAGASTPDEARAAILRRLSLEGIDAGRTELVPARRTFGALQDPGPVFLRRPRGGLAIADFASSHPDPDIDRLDRDLVAGLGMPAVTSGLVCDGGNRQANGHGVLMVGGTFADTSNPGVSREAMEKAYLATCGVAKIIWLGSGPRDEDWGQLEDGHWGIGTGGHIDEFCRFVDAGTVVLAEVPEADRALDSVHAETHRRMEENYALLRAATDIDGKALRILRVPTALPMTRTRKFNGRDPIERFWFEGAEDGQNLTFYLPGSYLNFVIANGVVVTSKYWREGMDDAIRQRDADGLAALQAAFPGRRVVQVDATPLLYDGAGLHCYTRNQPFPATRD